MGTRNAARGLLLALALALALVPACVRSAEPPDSPAGQEGSGPGGPGAGRFNFGIIGDLRYSEAEVPLFNNLTLDMNRADLDFVVHAGDFQSGGMPCTREDYVEAREELNDFAAPLVYTPGDNDWSDCDPATGDPLERLAVLRDVFFSTNRSLGERTLALERQSARYPENARWTFGNVMFATLHTVGNNNNLPPEPTARGNAKEHAERTAANLAWLEETFARATDRRSDAVVFVTQANPGFELPPEMRTGYNDLLAALLEQTARFPGQVVLIHGDTHYFRVDKPLSAGAGGRLVNFTRVETFGSPDVHWVHAFVDSSRREVFTFRPEIVEENAPGRLP